MTTIGVFSAIFDEQGRILLVKRAYGPKNWTTPGGRLEAGETPTEGLLREVLEESGYQVRPLGLVGIYSNPAADDLVILIRAEIVGRAPWQPDGEISECGFFERGHLPEPMHARNLARVMDAFDGKTNVLREFEREKDG